MPQDNAPNPWRWFGLGVEFAGSILALGLLGWYVDSRAGTQPWGALIGFSLGFIGATYLFIKEALKASRLSTPRRHPKPTKPNLSSPPPGHQERDEHP